MINQGLERAGIGKKECLRGFWEGERKIKQKELGEK